MLSSMLKQHDPGFFFVRMCPDNKEHGANMGPIWVLSVPGGPHVDPMNLAIWLVTATV